MAPLDRVQIGIVGAGEIVARVHLPVLSSLEGVQIAWICDRSEPRAAAVARAYGVPVAPLPPSPAALPAADIVLLGIPYGARWSFYDELAGRVTGLVIEKPLFRTVERHGSVCDTWPDHALGHGFQRRSLGVVRLCRDLIEHGTFGPLRSARFGLGAPGTVTQGGRYFGSAELSGGGVFFDTGVHGIDALLYLARATEARVTRARMVAEDGIDLDTDAELEIRTADGGTVEATLQVSCLRETSNRIDLVFDRARLRFSLFDTTGRLWLESDGAVRTLELSPAAARGYPRTSFQGFHAHWSAFLRGLREGRPNHTAARDALLTTAIVEQCYAAAGLHGEPGAP